MVLLQFPSTNRFEYMRNNIQIAQFNVYFLFFFLYFLQPNTDIRK